MKSKFSVLSLLLLIVVSRGNLFATESTVALADKAVSENATESAAAIAELRSLGPAGLNALMTRYDVEIRKHIDDPLLKPDAEWQRITKALDMVSGQKNSFISGLYWYTDLNEAQRVATKSGKPILSLRLLGNLTDELSCANSRFFRTVLYPNKEISSVLRDRFVLHWKSVRPAPIITIDFGDGRKLERTITGNSIHYVLDSSGHLLEALPGLYGPQAFLRGLTDAERTFKSVAGKNGQQRNGFLMSHYEFNHSQLETAWLNDTAKIGGKLPAGFVVEKDKNGQFRARSVALLAATKMVTESSIFRAMSASNERMEKVTDEDAWRKIAQLHASDAVLDSRSIALIRRQNPALSEEEFATMLKSFQELLALDTVRNDYLMRMKLYPWLVRDSGRFDLEKFNEAVYAELFLTPSSDAWLGLLSKDVYMGIDNGGVK